MQYTSVCSPLIGASDFVQNDVTPMRNVIEAIRLIVIEMKVNSMMCLIKWYYKTHHNPIKRLTPSMDIYYYYEYFHTSTTGKRVIRS